MCGAVFATHAAGSEHLRCLPHSQQITTGTPDLSVLRSTPPRPSAPPGYRLLHDLLIHVPPAPWRAEIFYGTKRHAIISSDHTRIGTTSGLPDRALEAANTRFLAALPTDITRLFAALSGERRLSTRDLSALITRSEAASPAPWQVSGPALLLSSAAHSGEIFGVDITQAAADFIVAARNQLPRLIAAAIARQRRAA